MDFSARTLMKKTCSVVDLLLWHAACDKEMCFFILSQQLSMGDMATIFLNGDSRMIGLAFSFLFFSDGFARGLNVLRQTSSSYSPSFTSFVQMSDMFTNSWFDPYFRHSAWTPSGPVTLLFLSFCDAFWISSGVNGVPLTGAPPV